jgi:hypothetical protein
MPPKSCQKICEERRAAESVKQGHCQGPGNHTHTYASAGFELFDNQLKPLVDAGFLRADLRKNVLHGSKEYDELKRMASDLCREKDPENKFVSVWNDWGYRCYKTCPGTSGGSTNGLATHAQTFSL